MRIKALIWFFSVSFVFHVIFISFLGKNQHRFLSVPLVPLYQKTSTFVLSLRQSEEGTLCNPTPAPRRHLNASRFSSLRLWMPRLLGDFRGIPTALSLRLFVQGTRCVCCAWVLFPFLSVAARVLMETRIPGGPHIKTRGIAALAFQTNITHFLCCLRDRGHDSLSPENLPPRPPPYPLHATHTPPSTPSRYHLPSSLPPHPTGAAKSKCQSQSGRCIPSGAPLLVATDGSAAWFQLYDNPLWWPINYPIGLEMRHLSTSLSLSPSPLSLSLLLSLSFSASAHADTSVHCDLFCRLDSRHAAYESHWSVPAKVARRREGWESSSSAAWAGGSFPPSLPRLLVSSWGRFFFLILLWGWP